MRITLRLQNLAVPLQRYADRHGLSVGAAAQRLLGQALGVEFESVRGTARLSAKERRDLARKAAAARWENE